MRFYMHPETAARLLSQSRAYRIFRKMGWNMRQARELAEIHANLQKGE